CRRPSSATTRWRGGARGGPPGRRFAATAPAPPPRPPSTTHVPPPSAPPARLPFRDDAFAAAGCAFGINHFPDPGAALAEMARVAPLVGVLTWTRPEAPYLPKQAVREVVARRAGSDRTLVGTLADELGERVGSPGAVRSLLEGAGLRPDAREVRVDLPWPGAAAFVDYRLATIGVAGLVDDPAAVRREALAAVAP